MNGVNSLLSQGSLPRLAAVIVSSFTLARDRLVFCEDIADEISKTDLEKGRELLSRVRRLSAHISLFLP